MLNGLIKIRAFLKKMRVFWLLLFLNWSRWFQVLLRTSVIIYCF